MRSQSLLALAILAAPALSPAQDRPADAAAPVPAPVYYPALDYRPRGVVATRETEPRKEREAWRDANADVGQFTRGHRDIVRWEQARPPAPEARP